MKKILLIILFGFMSLISFSQRIHYESYYQSAFSENIDGITEVYLTDRTRVDIMTDSHAIEVDFANKWAESIGQSLHYSRMTGKKPGILLIMENPIKDEKYLIRVINLAIMYKIDVWIINSNLIWKKIDINICYENYLF